MTTKNTATNPSHNGVDFANLPHPSDDAIDEAEDLELPFEEDNSDADIDLDQKEPLIPDGYYAAIVERVDMAFGPKGDPYFNVRFKLIDDKDDGKWYGKSAYEIMSFSERALPMTRRSLKALLGGGKFNYKSEQDRLYGCHCTLRIGSKKNNRDEDVNDVISVLPAGKSEPSESSGTKSTQLY